MTIVIMYHDKAVVAKVIDNYKVAISSKDDGLEDRIHEICIELDKCRNCGVWVSEDEELYGDGYCTKCAVMCPDCEQYFNHKDMYMLGGGGVVCTECYKKIQTTKKLL